MEYPFHLEYVKAVMSAADNFDKLKHLRPVLDDAGNPVMSSGNFAVVFKMEDTESGNFYAVKCFTREQKGREECYKMIHDELEYANSPYIVQMSYLEKELFVDSKASAETEFPVVFMEWIDGVNLDVYIKEHLNDKAALEMLAWQFSRLASWLITQPFAHGDLKPDNILVRPDGNLVLVDYDGMYVPAMKGRKSRETGSPNFRHPARTEDDFDEHIDDFPAVSILLSLKAIADDPARFKKYAAADRLLFTEKDYRDISKCKLLKELYPSKNNEINKLVSLFNIALLERSLGSVSYRLLNLSKPQAATAEPDDFEATSQEPEAPMQVIQYSIEIDDNLLKDAWTDKNGVQYSKDGKYLLSATNKYLKEYDIREGVEAIYEYAFAGCVFLKELKMPDSVTSIGERAFENCCSLQNIILPVNVESIGDWAFKNCESLKDIILPDKLKAISKGTFCGCKSLNDITIPRCVKSIKSWAFDGCSSLVKINIPNSVKTLGRGAFSGCKALKSVNIPKGVSKIVHSTFANCISLKSIDIPKNVKSIGEGAFDGCASLVYVVINNRDCKQHPDAFSNCESLEIVEVILIKT